MGGWRFSRMIRRRATVGGDEQDYLLRIYLIPRNKILNVHLHVWHASDSYDTVLHDHPWASLSILLRGRLTEHATADGSRPDSGKPVLRRKMRRFWPTFRRARHYHAIEVPPGQKRRPVTLFLTGRVVRSWNFWCRRQEKELPHDTYLDKGCD